MGVTPLPFVLASAPFCCRPFTPFAWPLPFAWLLPSFSEGGVIPPGKDKEAGEVKAVACCAVEGWVVRVSMLAVLSPLLRLEQRQGGEDGREVFSRQTRGRKVRRSRLFECGSQIDDRGPGEEGVRLVRRRR